MTNVCKGLCKPTTQPQGSRHPYSSDSDWRWCSKCKCFNPEKDQPIRGRCYCCGGILRQHGKSKSARKKRRLGLENGEF